MPIFAFLLAAVYTAVVIYRNIFLGGMPFWHDPARDLTLAGEMFSRFSFLGQPSGIPGFFYPPYWLWLLFSVLPLSRDPAVVTFLTTTLPYLIFFPMGLWLLRDKLSNAGVILILAVFVSKFDNYFTQLWNLNLTPLILLWIFIAFDLKKYFFSGILTALLVSFNFALGVPVAIAATVFSKFNHQFLLGNFIIFTPTILFELKNKFVMSKVLFPAIFSKAVNLSGLTKLEIIRYLLPGWTMSLFALAKRTGWFLALIVAVISCVYLRNSNPIWTYHFIGMETIYLIFFCLLIKSFLVKFEKPTITILAVFLFIKLFLLIKSPDNILNFDNLTTKKQITEFVLRDNINNRCGFAAYSRTAFERNYEYEYLLNLLSRNLNLPTPSINSNDNNCVYVVFPHVSENQLESYLNSVTEVGKFGTRWKKEFSSGLTVVFRERHERR